MYSNELICDILDYIDNNLNNVNVDDISYIFGYEKSYIMKKFKKELDVTIINYVNIIKILNSLKYINNEDLLLKAALESGYNSLEYYSEIFKKYLKVSPKSYRNLLYRKYLTDEKEEEKIKTNLSNLYDIKKRIENYKKHKKPNNTSIMKLQITKKKNSK